MPIPVFTSDLSEDVRLAEIAWIAAAECAGRSPAIAGSVTISRALPMSASFPGASVWSPGVPSAINLRTNAGSAVLAHEVAHAWAHLGPKALVEGRAQLLVQCIQGKKPGVFDGVIDVDPALHGMPDLVEWQGDALPEEALRAAYAGTFRLFRVIALVIPAETLWKEGAGDWPVLLDALRESGERGKPLLDALWGGASTQRAALEDLHRDGLPNVYETMVGSNPAAWDTDADGWWDGAPKPYPAGAVPLPRNGHAVCLPTVLPTDERALADITLRFGGFEPLPDEVVDIEPSGLVSWRRKWDGLVGGAWLAARGAEVAANPHCEMAPGITVRMADTPPNGALAIFTRAAHDARHTLAGVLGHEPRPAVITLRADVEWAKIDLAKATGEPSKDDRIHVPTRVLNTPDNARIAGVEAAALLAVIDIPGTQQSAAAEALIRSEMGGRGLLLSIGTHAYEVGPWLSARKKCASGWPGLLDGRCKQPDWR